MQEDRPPKKGGVMTEQVQKLLMNKKLTLIELAEELKNITRACKVMNYSRQQYYNIKEQYLKNGPEGLKPKKRDNWKHSAQADQDTENLVLTHILENPSYSYTRISDTLLTEKGYSVSEGKVRGIFNRHGLRNFKDRLKYLEKEHQKHGFKLSDEQKELLSRIPDQIDYKHLYAPHAGYLLCQDTFYVGYLKGVGKIYMQSVIDCSNSLAFAKLYTGKDALPATHILQDRVLPFYYRLNLRIHNLLTDNGTEYCGLDDHPYEMMLWLFGINHRRTRIKSPHTNGFVERFHQTVLKEFFQIKFRQKFYLSVEDLQKDLDEFLFKYNCRRAHRGYRNNGSTPIQTFMKNMLPLALPNLN